MTNKINIPVIHADDLKNLLQKYGLLERFESRLIKCSFCENTMTLDNLYGIQLENEMPNFICDSYDCHERLKEIENG